jgi:hypothetical protein
MTYGSTIYWVSVVLSAIGALSLLLLCAWLIDLGKK